MLPSPTMILVRLRGTRISSLWIVNLGLGLIWPISQKFLMEYFFWDVCLSILTHIGLISSARLMLLPMLLLSSGDLGVRSSFPVLPLFLFHFVVS